MTLTSTDDEEEDPGFRAACASLENALASLGSTLSVKTRGHDASKNRFDGLEDEGSDDSNSDEAEEPGAQNDGVNEHGTDDDDDDDGEWTEVVGDGRSKIKAVDWVPSKAMCDYFSSVYNKYFKVYTGKELGFIITPQSQPYVSTLEACLRRDRLLATLFDERPVVVDPFGGSGSDICMMLFNLYPKEIYCSDAVFGQDVRVRQKEGGIMQHNYENMMMLFEELKHGVHGMKPPVIHTPVMQESIQFIRSLPENLHVDILNLDPCWSRPGQKYEMDPTQMASYLKANVFTPLKERNITPKCILLKTRWAADHLENIMGVLPGQYFADYSVEATPFKDFISEIVHKNDRREAKGRFHWTILVHHQLKNIVWHQSEAYKRLVKQHKSVTVLLSSLVRPNIPLYANRIPFPVMVQHETTAATVTVEPPKLPRKGKAMPRKGKSKGE